MKANDFEMCGGGTPGRVHTVVCPHCYCVLVLSWVPSQLGCAKSEGGCGKIVTPFRVYAKDRARFLIAHPEAKSGFRLHPDEVKKDQRIRAAIHPNFKGGK